MQAILIAALSSARNTVSNFGSTLSECDDIDELTPRTSIMSDKSDEPLLSGEALNERSTVSGECHMELTWAWSCTAAVGSSSLVLAKDTFLLRLLEALHSLLFSADIPLAFSQNKDWLPWQFSSTIVIQK